MCKLNIAVLLSTWNGDKYIEEQINSVLTQNLESTMDMKIYIRDDGSTDLTKNIIERFELEHNNIVLIEDDLGNLGPKHSFYELVKCVDADYYFFCDQDDIWQPDKLRKSLLSLGSISDVPKAFFSDLLLINASGIQSGVGFWERNNIKVSLFNQWQAFMTNSLVTGCTVGFNNATKDIYLSVPKRVIKLIYHDQLVASIASKFGSIHYSEEKLIQYRIHEGNSVGNSRLSIVSLIDKLRGFISNYGNYKDYAKLFGLSYSRFTYLKLKFFLKRLL